MSLSLPADIEPYCDSTEDYHKQGAYALVLNRPDNFLERWDRHHDKRPDWLSAARTADVLAYVGGSSDILSRLEDHRDGEVRQTTLTRVCEIDRLHTLWYSVDEDWRQTEFRLAKWLANERLRWFVHQR
jgi:predicted GIY-YIG superfamily endonuclease